MSRRPVDGLKAPVGGSRSRAGSFDLVVVGGGISGASALWHASAIGMRALLLERHHLAAGPSGSSTANVRRHYSTPALAHVAAESFGFYSDFHRLTGFDAGFDRVGVLLAVAAHEVEAFAASVSRLRARGARVDLLGPMEIAARIPGARLDDVAAAVYEPDGGYADATAAVNGFAEGAVRAGASIRTRTRVSAVRVDAGRVTGVELADGRHVRSPRVLLAAGPWTNDVLATVGSSVPTFAERNVVAVLHLPGRAKTVLPSVFSDRSRRYYARPDGESVILLGGRTSRTAPVDGLDRFDRAVPLDESAEIVGRAGERLPQLGTADIRPGFAGLYDVSPDGLPIVGPVPGVKGLFVWTGTSGHGFRLAPGLAALLVERMGGRRAQLLDHFRMDREYTPTGELTPR